MVARFAGGEFATVLRTHSLALLGYFRITVGVTD